MRPSRLLLCAVSCLVPLVLTAVSAAAAPVEAASLSVSFSPIDLAQRTLQVQGAPDLRADTVLLVGTIPQEIPGCTLGVSDGELSGDCEYLWAMREPAPIELELRATDTTLRLSLSRGWVSGGRAGLDPATRELVLPAGFPSTSLTLFDYAGDAGDPDRRSGWTELDVHDDRVVLDKPTFEAALRASGRFYVYAAAGQGVVAYQVLAWPTPTPATTVAREPADVASSPRQWVTTHGSTKRGDWTVTVPDELACPPQELPRRDMIVVCVDATKDVLSYRLIPEDTRVTKPNRYFFVQVLHFVDRRVEVNLGGQIGSWVPGTRGDLRVGASRGAGGGRGSGIGGAQGGVPDLTVSTQTLAPRRPGFAPLSVRLEDAQGAAIGAPLLVEFWIDETFSGAFRLGVAGVFLGGVEQSYQKVTAPNSQQAEIRASGTNPVDLDLVVGYAPYLDAGGRSATGCERAPFCFSPYFGLGVMSASHDGSLAFLKSVHLGVEWELTPTFSIGLTANLRRVQRLAEGYHPGMPIAGEIPTEDKYVLGAGVVINLSPSFFKIGASGAAALLR